jgi:hypothetical protein
MTLSQLLSQLLNTGCTNCSAAEKGACVSTQSLAQQVMSRFNTYPNLSFCNFGHRPAERWARAAPSFGKSLNGRIVQASRQHSSLNVLLVLQTSPAEPTHLMLRSRSSGQSPLTSSSMDHIPEFRRNKASMYSLADLKGGFLQERLQGC